MKKSEFEKRHGRIYMAPVSNWDGAIAKKYDLNNPNEQPAHIWYMMQNLTGKLDLEIVQNFFKYLSSESRKEVREQYLRCLDYIYFAQGWGRLARENPESLSKEDQKEVVKLIKCINRGFKKYRFKPSYARNINYWIIKFGGHIATKQDFETATKKIQNAEKLPRKLKKQVKKGFFGNLFNGRAK